MNDNLKNYFNKIFNKKVNKITLSEFIAAFTDFAKSNNEENFYSYADAVVHIFDKSGEILKIESFLSVIPYNETSYVVSLQQTPYKFEIKQNQKEFTDIEKLFKLCIAKHQAHRKNMIQKAILKRQQEASKAM